MTAIVTGGRRGIGLAITEALQKAGHKVAVIGTWPDGPGDLYVRVDLTDETARLFLISSVEVDLGPIDILVNNAGVQPRLAAITTGDDQFRKQLELMLVAPFDLCRQAALSMTEEDRGGHIINILSTSAFQGAKNIAGYVAAKHGLLGLTRALAIEWAPQIHVNAVAPGLTETDMIDYIDPERRQFLESITPSGRFSRPEEIAQAVMFLVQSENIYGQVITVDGGWMVKNG